MPNIVGTPPHCGASGPVGPHVLSKDAPTEAPRLGSAYWRLWTAGTISNLGDGIDLAALPLLAASLTRDPRLVAGLSTAAGLPWLFFALVAGAIVDRTDRRALMVRVNVARGLLGSIGGAIIVLLIWNAVRRSSHQKQSAAALKAKRSGRHH